MLEAGGINENFFGSFGGVALPSFYKLKLKKTEGGCNEQRKDFPQKIP